MDANRLDTNFMLRLIARLVAMGAGAPADTDALPEGLANLYFTEARVRGTDLAGIDVVTTGTISSADTVLGALGKLEASKQVLLVSGTNIKTVNGVTLLGAGNLAVGTGSVTTVSVVAANGFDGTVANAGTTPAITLKTTVTGLVKGDGTALSAATSGTDYLPVTDPILLGMTYFAQPAETTKAAAATLTIAELLTKIIKYTGAAANLTLPTGANIDAGIVAGLAADRAFEFCIINTGAGTATVLTAAGLTLVGSMAVAAGTSGQFRVRKTAASTFTVYRTA